jgi:hypothetical protein
MKELMKTLLKFLPTIKIEKPEKKFTQFPLIKETWLKGLQEKKESETKETVKVTVRLKEEYDVFNESKRNDEGTSTSET